MAGAQWCGGSLEQSDKKGFAKHIYLNIGKMEAGVVVVDSQMIAKIIRYPQVGWFFFFVYAYILCITVNEVQMNLNFLLKLLTVKALQFGSSEEGFQVGSF